MRGAAGGEMFTVMAERRLVIVDDDPLVRAIIASELRARGHQVVERDRCTPLELDLVLVDLRVGYREHEEKLARLLADRTLPVAVVGSLTLA